MNRDVDLDDWTNGTKHHAPTDQLTIEAHQMARELVAELGAKLHLILPAGRDKSLVYTALEEVLMRSNRAIAINGGPKFASLDFEQPARAVTPLEFEPDRELHEGKRKPTFRSTLKTSAGTTRIDVSAEQVAPNEGYVQVAVLASPEIVRVACPEPDFEGFYAGLTTAEEWAAAVRELTAAGAHVWGGAAIKA